MAFTNSPVKDTYSEQRVPLVHDLMLLPGKVEFGTDNVNLLSGTENVLPIKDQVTGEVFGITRPGMGFTTLTTGLGQTCRGVYVWEKTAGFATYFFVVTGDGANTHIWSSPDGVTWTNIHTWASPAQRNPCRFTEFITSTNVKSLVLLTGDRGYVFTSNAAGTQIVDVDFPANHVPFPVFLNGRLYVAKVNTGDIYNSALNDPLTWTAGDFISSEVYPDDVQALVKVNNYIVAIGGTGSEYFYDAANATGSPLARYDGGLQPFGTIFPYTIANSKGGFTFLARNNDGGLAIKHVEGFQVKEISTESVGTLILNYLTNNTGNGQRIYGIYLRAYGSLHYILTFDGTLSVGSGVVANSYVATIAYSFNAKMWCRFSYPSTYHGDQYPVTFISPVNSSSGAMFMAGTTFDKVFYGKLSETYALDNGQAIRQRLNLPPQTFGTTNRKFMSRVGIRVVTGAPTTAINFSYNDAPGSTTFTSAGNFGNLNTFPYITQLGSFRDRHMKISTTSPTLQIKWDFLEVDINKGQQ